MTHTLKVAIQGCCHGELSKIYNQLLQLTPNQLPDLLIICGDFQSVRFISDLSSLNVPIKYQQLGDFHEYFTGVKKAPIRTIFIGGNHEASDYLMSLPYGGWVCENIYYMGFSGVIWFKGLRIGGISGIFKKFDFYKDHYEKLPLIGNHVKSCYHTRFEDQLKMLLLLQNNDDSFDKNLDCMISHDWPVGITDYGNSKRLLKIKPFFKEDIQRGELGSKYHWDLLKRIKPNFWFAAHLHVKFQAIVPHNSNKIGKRKLSIQNEKNVVLKKVKNLEEIELDLDNEEVLPPQNPDEILLSLTSDEDEQDEPVIHKIKGFTQTNFLALDKCTHRNENLEIIEIPISNINHISNSTTDLYYDKDFLKIIKFFKQFQSTEFYKNLRWNDLDDVMIRNLQAEINTVQLNDEHLIIPFNFEQSLENPTVQTQLFVDKFLK